MTARVYHGPLNVARGGPSGRIMLVFTSSCAAWCSLSSSFWISASVASTKGAPTSLCPQGALEFLYLLQDVGAKIIPIVLGWHSPRDDEDKPHNQDDPIDEAFLRRVYTRSFR